MPSRNNDQRLRTLLNEVRSAKPDARGFAWFERRDELARLGVPHAVSDLVNPDDDAALDRINAQAKAPRSGVQYAVVVTGAKPPAPRRTQSAGPAPSFPPPTQDLHTGEVRDFLEREARKRGVSIDGYPGSFDLDNDGRRYETLDAGAIAATDDIIRKFRPGEFTEAGVKLFKRGVGGGYKYSRGIAGGPTEIPSTQWDKLRSWWPGDKEATNLHFHGATGPQSLKPSNGVDEKGRPYGDVPFAQKHFGDAGQYIFNWQDGKLRYFGSQGREVRVVREYPNWKPR